MKWNKRSARIMLTILVVALVGMETQRTIMQLLNMMQQRAISHTRMNLGSIGFGGESDPFTRTGRNSRSGRRGGRNGRRGGRNDRRGRNGGLLLDLDGAFALMTISYKDGKRYLESVTVEDMLSRNIFKLVGDKTYLIILDEMVV